MEMMQINLRIPKDWHIVLDVAAKALKHKVKEEISVQDIIRLTLVEKFNLQDEQCCDS